MALDATERRMPPNRGDLEDLLSRLTDILGRLGIYHVPTQAQQVYMVNASAASGGDGAINDGDNSAVKATVRDLANGNPLAVQPVDGTGAAVLPASQADVREVRDRLPAGGGLATESTLGTVAKEGTPVTGEALEQGGASVLGWLSSLRKRLGEVRDRLPAALGADGGLKVDAAPAGGLPVAVQGTVPVSGPVTDAELRASPVPVSGPATNAELRASPLPVSGPLTDAELRASAVPVSVAGVAQEATLGGVKTQSEVATDTKTFIVDLGTSRSDVALNGASFTFYWVRITFYDGAGSTVGASDLTGDFYRLGTAAKPKHVLSALTRPDEVVAFVGRMTGDIYLSNAAQSGKRLVIEVGV